METESKTEKLRPPYASSGVADAMIDLFRRLNPPKIDSKFIVENNIATTSNAFTALDFTKWVGITDLEGNVISEVAQKLRLVGEERNKYIKEIIEKSYADLFEKINVAEAKKEDVVNYFVTYHKMGSGAAKYAAALFLHLCYKYGIPIAEGLKKKTHTGSKKGRPKKDKKENKKSNENPQKTKDNPRPEKNLNEGEILIEISGNGGLYFPFLAKNKTELENLVETQIKPIIEVIKLRLPNKEE